MPPKVSVIIPCYNYERFVCNAIESCLEQDYKGEIEVIIVDDASTDRSFAEMARLFAGRIKVKRLKHNKGYSYAKNEGIAMSTGDYIATLDADDMLTRDSISNRAEMLKYKEILMVHANAYTIIGDGDIHYWEKRIYKLEAKPRRKIHAQTVMVKRQLHVQYGLYDEDLRSRSDNEMWHRLKAVAKIDHKIAHIDKPVAFYRKHENSMIEFRKKNKPYNTTVSNLLEDKKALRFAQGITDQNTRFLKK